MGGVSQFSLLGLRHFPKIDRSEPLSISVKDSSCSFAGFFNPPSQLFALTLVPIVPIKVRDLK